MMAKKKAKKSSNLVIVPGGKQDEENSDKSSIETIPELQEFTCWSCHGSCVIYPRSKPVAVQHALPKCKEWERIEDKYEDIERFLIKCGAHIFVPQRTS